MMRKLLTIIVLLALLPAAASAQMKNTAKKRFIFRYYLTDKRGSNYTLDKPQRFLSAKSLERRKRQGLALDSTDLPVAQHYVKQFRTTGPTTGTQVLGTSRWQNTVLVSSTDSMLLVQLTKLPFVKDARCVYVGPRSPDEEERAVMNVQKEYNRWDSVANDRYGMGRQQIEMLGGVRLHEVGHTGKGITIAILDGGFQNYHRIPALQHATVVGTHDFVCPANNSKGGTQDPHSSFHHIDHGTKVFSAMAAWAPEVMVGTAPDAQYWLLRSEDDGSEQPVEEDYWTMGAEFADSVGADVINSSLGYYSYDAPLPSYRLRDLDGQTAFVSRSASLLAGKGMILCNSAGNSGMGAWKKIGVPADARDILTVGAVDGDGNLAPFSSVGPSQDGRVKPDVVARGSNTALISGKGRLVYDMGTSFSTPVTCGMVACLWSALPGKTAKDIMRLVRESADQHDAPNNIFGYGLPNFMKAYLQSIAEDYAQELH